jgi:adenylate cyclase
MSPESKLAVILHADIVDSTAQVQIDERVAHQRFKDAFESLSVVIREHGGRTHELRGDALVAEFPKASDSVLAAVEFQAKNRSAIEQLDDEIRPKVRVGIALGEVVIADNTVTGSGVVLAQRLEQLAPSGGICISAAIREAVPGRIKFAFKDIGEQRLKGFERSQRAYLVADPSIGEQAETPSPEEDLMRQAARRASIAVLPFDNLSNNADQDYFADGMSEDIIAGLARFRALTVAARNSAFAYKGEAPDTRAVARDLGVRYVLEGSVRQSGQRVRVSAQLVDAEAGTHIWAERFDRDLTDIFQVQDELTEAIVAAIAPEVGRAEIDRVRRRPPDALDTWEQSKRGDPRV